MQTITDEKLDEYMGIWSDLYHQRSPIEVALYEEHNPFIGRLYYITFGAEVRELTLAQSRRVYHWMHSLGERELCLNQ